jgi:decaprenylphospho-beta-D-ribofuranose 2-oxidase
VSAHHRSILTGWGGTNPTAADVVTVAAADAPSAVKGRPPRGVIARGLGRAYGDAAQNAGGRVLRLADGVSTAVLDEAAGRLTCGAGVSIDDLLRVLVPRGFFVPVTAGTRFVTVGGAIASDIHGKNHHVDGTFGSHVHRLSLLLADSSVVEIGPDRDPELFWATLGGMGLTGVVLDATFDLIPIESSRCIVDTTRAADLDEVLALMAASDDRYRYSVAWLDVLAKGRHLGRSVLTLGDHARLDQLDPVSRRDPYAFAATQMVGVPPLVPPTGVLNRWSLQAFNEVWYRKSPKHRTGQLVDIPGYFHPLDFVGSWNRLYGTHGFVQYQIIVPFGREDALRAVIEQMAASGTPSFLTVLKRFGAANPAPLSFPRPGWTLTLDIPAARLEIGELLHRLDDLVLDAGGRHYLAKDAHLSASSLARGYPRLEEWKATRRRVDPDGVFRSDLARRLELIDRDT